MLISGSPGRDVPLRAICEEVGVKLPTLYHHFGDKEGLLDAVVEHGFDRYLSLKESSESSGDPVEDIRSGWDTHAGFGVANPGFYALMYGKVIPGFRPTAQSRATTLLHGLAEAAHRQGRLVVSSAQAADQILAANVGLTLHLITAAEPDWALSQSLRDATLAGVTGEWQTGHPDRATPNSEAAERLLRSLAHHPPAMADPELTLLRKWLAALARP